MPQTNVKPLFPLGIATGVAHCNRREERQTLKNSIRHGRHTWLWARRRMGKTSLIEQVLGELQRSRPAIPSIKLDLNVVHDAESLEERIRDGVARLAVALLPRGRKHRANLLATFQSFSPEISVGGLGVNLRLRAPEAIAPGISDLLMALDEAAGSYNRRAVLVLDEFQQLASLTYGRTSFSLEGAIRHAVERARHITYVFSGSERRLLQEMFEQPDRPLYRHCEKMSLSRIAPEHYRAFLGKASKARWQSAFPDECVDTVLALTRRHPYYVNALCSRLWERGAVPKASDIGPVWDRIAEQDEPIVSHQVRNLSATQRAMLVGIARAERVEYPTGREFLESVRLSTSTGAAAKDVLEENDLIRYDQTHWELVDPVMAHYITRS